MSHFACLVLTGSLNPNEIDDLLRPYDENGEWFAEGSRWDWWMVGGRFSGMLGGYDPATDPANVAVCDLCGGTGTRPDGLERFGAGWVQATQGCNGCRGTGRRLKWPTEWEAHESDHQPVAALRPVREWDHLPTAVVTPDGKWYEQARMGWFGVTIPDETGADEKAEAPWAATVQALLDQYPDAHVAVVDCHV